MVRSELPIPVNKVTIDTYNRTNNIQTIFFLNLTIDAETQAAAGIAFF